MTTEQLLSADPADAGDGASTSGGAMPPSAALPPITDTQQEPGKNRLTEAEARALLRKHSKPTTGKERDPLEGDDDSDPLLSHSGDAERDPLGEAMGSPDAAPDDGEPDSGDKSKDDEAGAGDDSDHPDESSGNEGGDSKEEGEADADDADEPQGRRRLNIFRKNERGEYVHGPRERTAMQHADDEGISFLEAWHRLFGDGAQSGKQDAAGGASDHSAQAEAGDDMSSDEIHRKIQDLRQKRKHAAMSLDTMGANDITEQIEDLLGKKGAALEREAERGRSSRDAADRHETAQSASMERAGALFPHAVKQGSQLHVALTREISRIEKTNPGFFSDPDWPEMLTAKLAHRMGIAPILVKAAAAIPAAPASSKPVIPKQAARPAPAPGGISGAPRQTGVQDYLKKLAAARESGNPAEIAKLMGMAKELERQRTRPM